MTQQELADRAGVDVKTVGSLEARGRWPIARTRAVIERALHWPSGEMERIAEREEEPDIIPPGLREHVRKLLPPDRAAAVEAAIEAALRGEAPARGPDRPRGELAG